MEPNRLTLATFIFLLAAPMALGQSGPPAASEDAQVTAARLRYQANAWPVGERLAGYDLRGLSLPRMTGEDIQFQADSGQVLRRYLDAKGRPALHVELVVAEGVGAAQAALLNHIAYIQSTKTLPRTAERNVRAGDIGYVGYAGPAEERVAWVAFVQGNIEVRVVNLNRTGLETTDLIEAVETLSRSIARAEKRPEGALPRPTVTLATEQVECQMGDRVLLSVDSADPAGTTPELSFEVLGTGQGYVERGEDGNWAFHATNAGDVTLVLSALGGHGTLARASLTLEVGRLD